MNEPDTSRDIPQALWPGARSSSPVPRPGAGATGAGGGVMSYPEDSWVEVRYPLTGEQEHGDRAAWPWLPGWVVAQCGPDEWEICVQAPELAMERRGRDGVPGVLPGFLRAARPGRGTGGRAMTTWNDPPGSVIRAYPGPGRFLPRLIGAIRTPRARTGGRGYGPVTGRAPRQAGS